jgi:hypothetical protein
MTARPRWLGGNRYLGAQHPRAVQDGRTQRESTMFDFAPDDEPPIGIWLAVCIWIAVPLAWTLAAWWLLLTLAREQ